jgi:hypothetical protein
MIMRRLILVALLAAGAAGCAAAPGPAPGPSTDLSFELRRGACFGFCPMYRVRIDGDGTVTWEGERFVGTKGHASAKVDPARVQVLARRFREARFFALKDEYRAQVTDMPTYILSFRDGNRSKVVVDYAGQMAGMPAVVTELEKAVDATAGTHRWIAGGEKDRER